MAKNIDDITFFLEKHAFFSILTEKERAEFIDVLDVKIFKKDDIIFKQGDLGDSLYLVKDGLIRIFIADKEMEETIALMKQGDIFGEVALYDTHQRSAHAMALTTSTVLVLTLQKFEELKTKNPQLTSKILQLMLKILSKRLRLTTMKLYGQFQF
ncbi:MAG: cyclic nucleotide-binding domain-containing protein [Elusimicrobia bacterium]|nr:cyclic nucleotide-binding domain-containing protein [Elusimicrobiota bacterium]